MFSLKKEIAQCKRIFNEINKPENKRSGFAMLATAGLEEMLKSAQHRMRLTAFGAGVLAFLAGFGVCWLVFLAGFGVCWLVFVR